MSNKTHEYLELINYLVGVSDNSSDTSSVNQTGSTVRRTQLIKDDEEFQSLLSNLMKSMRDSIHQTNITNTPDSCDYCEGEFREVIEAYNRIHGYVILLVCTIGVIANALNVAVLTRKDMAAAPINRLLKWLAVADVFVMLEFIPFSIYTFWVLSEKLDFPYSWAIYVLFHMHFAQIMHTVYICLNMSLAIWRYIAIKYSDRSHILCTERRCSIAILTSFILPPILCAPSFMVFHIHTKNVTQGFAYHVDLEFEGRLYQANFWVHGVIIKVLPCFMFTVISAWLIQALYSANRRQKNLRNSTGCPAAENTVKRQMKADKRTDRTTKMLLAVLLLFLVTKLPQGILGLMSALIGWCFFKSCYSLFGNLMDILALFNGAINFALYCSMSQQFRQTFRQMVLQPLQSRWLQPVAVPLDLHA